jgi:hypothetical protein
MRFAIALLFHILLLGWGLAGAMWDGNLLCLSEMPDGRKKLLWECVCIKTNLSSSYIVRTLDTTRAGGTDREVIVVW